MKEVLKVMIAIILSFGLGLLEGYLIEKNNKLSIDIGFPTEKGVEVGNIYIISNIKWNNNLQIDSIQLDYIENINSVLDTMHSQIIDSSYIENFK